MKHSTFVLLCFVVAFAVIALLAVLSFFVVKIPYAVFAVLALAFVVQIWSSRVDRQTSEEQAPPPPDDGLDESLLPKVPEILEVCGEREPAALPENVLPLAPRVRAFLETWKDIDFARGLEFEGVFSDYKRDEIARYDENPEFVVLGGDGGEQMYFVRRNAGDERVYVVDLEVDSDYTKPRSYASDIDRWIVLRRQDALAAAEFERAEREKKTRKKSRRKHPATNAPAPHAESAEGAKEPAP